MRIYSLKRKSIPKVAVLVTGLAAAIVVATINPAPAQAYPRAASCAGCHGAATAGTTTATPSTTTVAPGTTYQVAINITDAGNGGLTGYGIVPVTAGTGSTFGGGSSAARTYSATMTAPAAAGTYSYTVWTNQGITDGTGRVGSVVYSIVVGAAPTTVPPTTVPPTTVPPTTVPPTTVPPTTVPPTTVPPTTVPPATSTARIDSLSTRHGRIGTAVTISGAGFGTTGVVQFGAVAAVASSWTDTMIVVTVPAMDSVTIPATSDVDVPVWYRHSPMVLVTVAPSGTTTSNAVRFRVVRTGHGYDAKAMAPLHGVAGDLD